MCSPKKQNGPRFLFRLSPRAPFFVLKITDPVDCRVLRFFRSSPKNRPSSHPPGLLGTQFPKIFSVLRSRGQNPLSKIAGFLPRCSPKKVAGTSLYSRVLTSFPLPGPKNGVASVFLLTPNPGCSLVSLLLTHVRQWGGVLGAKCRFDSSYFKKFKV